MTKGDKLIEGIFTGATINTPSMICVEDYLDALQWADKEGGKDALIKRSEANLAVVREWVNNTPWASFLAKEEATVSPTSICLSIDGLDKTQLKKMTTLLESENVAYDIGSYRDAPAGLRIWGGATVEESDMKKLMPWLNWAYDQAKL
jgi:phosphoserine aminotransferase